MKTRKWYAAWVKILLSVIALISLTAASISGVFVLWYGVGMNVFEGRPFEESGIVNAFTRRGPNSRAWIEVDQEIRAEPGIQKYIDEYNQTMVDIYSYYRYLNTPNYNATRSQTPEYYQMLYQNTNIRARVVLLDAQGNVTATLCALGGDWDQNTVLVDRMSGTHMQSPILFEIGFDKIFPVKSDLLAREARSYRTFAANQNMLLVVLAVSVVFFCISVLLLLLAAGHRQNDTEIHLRFFDHWAFAIIAIPLFLALVGLFWLADDRLYLYRLFLNCPQITWNTEMICISMAAILWSSVVLILFGFRTVLVRIKARRFWSTTLCYYVFHPIWERIKKKPSKKQKGNSETQPLTSDFVLDNKEVYSDSPRFSVDGEKVQATVQEFAHKTQDTVQELAQKTQGTVQELAQKTHGAMQQAVEKAKEFEWEGSRVQRILHKIWNGLRRIGKVLYQILSRLDIMGLGMLSGVLVVLVYIFSNVFEWFPDRLLFMSIFSVLVLVGLYFVLRQFVRLQAGVKKLAEGELTHKVDTQHLHGPFRVYAENLNDISAGMMVEVERRMKSEHLKTELLTNVSHDIKTPLTSIINYVDLLKKQDIEPEEAKEYVEVLERQSYRLKKLLEDLIEASKAATGNIAAELAPTDAAELLRQAEGEYNERLKEQQLIPILRIDTETCSILADGRLLWRVFDNLLGNIVKYAMPGTRVYLELLQKDDRCVITIRNISRDELGIEAEELMERFVRGDAARATEGSGLGLSIARSLTECMKGGFDLVLDGDLFKVILDFPLV